MTEEKCPKHNVSLKLRRNVETGELALACPFCDAEEPPKKRQGKIASAAATNFAANRLPTFVNDDRGDHKSSDRVGPYDMPYCVNRKTYESDD